MNGIRRSNVITRSALTALGLPVLAAGILASAPGASAAPGHQVVDGSLTWGVKASFRHYLTSAIAKGNSEPLNGVTTAADGAFIFPKGTGAVAGSGVTSVSFQGAVHFTGHEGILDFSLANPKLQVNALGKGTLEMTKIEANGASSKVVIADVSGSAPQVKEGKLSINSLQATLTDAGTKVFSYEGNAFYPAGTVMDPVSVSATLADDPTTKPTAPAQPTSPTGSATSPAQPTSPTGSATAPAQPTSPAGHATAPTTPSGGVPTSPAVTPSTSGTGKPAPTASATAPAPGPKVDTDYVSAGSDEGGVAALVGGIGVLAVGGGAVWVRRSSTR